MRHVSLVMQVKGSLLEVGSAVSIVSLVKRIVQIIICIIHCSQNVLVQGIMNGMGEHLSNNYRSFEVAPRLLTCYKVENDHARCHDEHRLNSAVLFFFHSLRDRHQHSHTARQPRTV
jgi:hypothetical protein